MDRTKPSRRGEEGEAAAAESLSTPTVLDTQAEQSPESSAAQDTIQEESAAADPVIPCTTNDILPGPETASSNVTLKGEDCVGRDKDTGRSLGSFDRTASDDSQHLVPDLAPGSTWGPELTPEVLASLKLPPSTDAEKPGRVIWVSFPPSSTQNPFFFASSRKFGITAVATLFTLLVSMNPAAYSISKTSMMADLGCSEMSVSVGLGLYCFGFAITPMVLAPLSEEFGRRWTYLVAVVIFLLVNIMMALAQNSATMLVARIIQGCAGSVGSTLVGGTIADIYMPAQRGLPSAVFAMTATMGTGLGPVMFCWVESDERLQWRWVWWIQSMMIVAIIPPILVIMRETRESVILRRRASRLRKERGDLDGGRYTAWSEVNRVTLFKAMTTSSIRPFTFLFVEPVVAFFALWVSIAWGVLYSQIGGMSYVFKNIYGFNTNQIGLVYLSIVIGSIVGFASNFIQDAVYRRRIHKDGIEARLYSPMVAGLTFAVGCFWFGFSSVSTVHWIVPCIGIGIIIASCVSIYVSAFVYLSECYGSYASSAIAAQSFLRNAFGGAFSIFTITMYEALTPRWTTFTWGCVALILASVPFVAYYKGQWIRAHSKYSKILMKEERERIEREKEVLDGLG